MCGICGIFQFDGALDQGRVHSMLSVLSTRGPDGQNIWSAKQISLGHARLKVIDLSSQSDQPMVDEFTKNALVFNGVILNYKALRQELIELGYQFNSSGDAEVILKAYQHWGDDCVNHLDGEFAFAIWDDQKQSLFLARDPFGIKPLYFYHSKYQFIFASTLPALLKAGEIDTTIDPIGLQFQLSFHGVIPPPTTLLKNIRKWPQAHVGFVDQTGIRWHQYQALTPPAQYLSGSSLIDKIDATLKHAVEKRIKACDVEPAVLLSGGIDSSLIVAYMNELGQKNIPTFSIGFESDGNEQGDEFERSCAIAKFFNTSHHPIKLGNHAVLDALPNAVRNMAEPMTGQDTVAFYLLAQTVSQSHKLVLSGQGADEAFAGYFWYPQFFEKIDQYKTPQDCFKAIYLDRPMDEYQQTVSGQYQHSSHLNNWLCEHLKSLNPEHFLGEILNLDRQFLVVDDPVKRVDNMTMAFGLETRVPFMDVEVMKLASSCSPKWLIQKDGKYPLKVLAQKYLPSSVLNKPKGYFPMPALKIVKGGFYEYMKAILLSQKTRQRGLYDMRYVQKLLDKPNNCMTALNGNRLWHLTVIEAWLQTHT